MGKVKISGRYHRRPNKIEDDYIVNDTVLGSGFNGDVFLATSRLQPGKFAVKSFRIDDLPPHKLELMRNEVENYLTMDHPHVARLYDCYESDRSLHMVMECLEGGELHTRVAEKKRFSEEEAAGALWQILLVLNYIHHHGIVHRDLKLQNFLYDSKESNHLKLIDFGFSKMVLSKAPMSQSLGTLAYVAPEVLHHRYTSKCDLWSTGVIAFVLLGGYMPFKGATDEDVERDIKLGRFNFKPERFEGVSEDAIGFIKALLVVDPEFRMTAEEALNHRWFQARRFTSSPLHRTVDIKVVEALQQFSKASKFRRCCLELVAQSLSNSDTAKVRDEFEALDAEHCGTITIKELRGVLVDTLQLVDEAEAAQVFEALDFNHDQEIYYSDFLAAMVSTQVDLHDELIRSAFKRLDTDGTGFVTTANLKQIVGDDVDGVRVEKLIQEADANKDGRLSFEEFANYIRHGGGGACDRTKSPSWALRAPHRLRGGLSFAMATLRKLNHHHHHKGKTSC